MHFQDKFFTLFNSVQSLDVNLSFIRTSIICREKCQCRDVVDSHLHFHSITKADVKKAIHRLKSNKIGEGGILSLIIVFMVLIYYIGVYLCYLI